MPAPSRPGSLQTIFVTQRLQGWPWYSWTTSVPLYGQWHRTRRADERR